MKEGFNPRDKKLKVVADLPKEEQGKYADVPSRDSWSEQKKEVVELQEGFVKKEALEAADVAELAAIARDRLEDGIDVQHLEAEGYHKFREKLISQLETVHNDSLRTFLWIGGQHFGKSRETGKPYSKLHDLISEDRGLLLEAGRNWPATAMEAASETLRDDKDFVLKLIGKAGRTSPDILFIASDRLKDDEDVVVAAIKQYPWAIAFSSERLKNKPSVVLLAARSDSAILEPGMEYSHHVSGTEGRVESPTVGEKVREMIAHLMERVDKKEEGNPARELQERLAA